MCEKENFIRFAHLVLNDDNKLDKFGRKGKPLRINLTDYLTHEKIFKACMHMKKNIAEHNFKVK
jgi:hypothetical protein